MIRARYLLLFALFMIGARLSAWSTIDDVILSECQAYGVPFAVAERLITSESNWDPRALNPNDPSAGIAQLNLNFLDWFSEMFNAGERIDPFNAVLSVKVMVRYLAWLHRYAGTWQRSVIGYKAGLSRVDHVGESTRKIAAWVAGGY